MANANGLTPFSMQPGRIQDFVDGMEDSKDSKAVTFLGGAVLGWQAVGAWSAFRGYLKGKK